MCARQMKERVPESEKENERGGGGARGGTTSREVGSLSGKMKEIIFRFVMP